MSQLVVRNLEKELHDKLRDRAQLHGCSVEEEVREILRATIFSAASPPHKLGSWCRQQFGGNPDLADQPFEPDELRGDVPKPFGFVP